MAKTRHIGKRMSQRGIRQTLVDLVLQFGEGTGDRCILNRRGLEEVLRGMREIERTMMRALDKGGVVVVQADSALITTYNLDCYDRRRVHGN